MKKRNVLVFPAGTEIGLEIYSALKHCKEVNVFGANQDISNHAKFVFPHYHLLPSIHDSAWLDAFVALVQQMQIDYIFPAYDDVIVALSEVAGLIPATIISSPATACRVTRSKSATYRALFDKVRVPHTYASHDVEGNYPVLVKPDRGQGSQNVYRVSTPDELHNALSMVRDPIICEYLPGDEFTVDCFSDREKGLLFSGVRIRSRIRNGIAVNTATVELPEAMDMAAIIGEALELRGAWFFQLKRAADGQLVLLEVAPRISGSMATHRVLGVNFPLLSIFEHERLPLKIAPIHAEIEMDRALCNRYHHKIQFGTLYVDLDDSLILDGEVNLSVIRLIYQCLNKGKKVSLITRHKGDLAATLARYRLQGLFDEIIQVPSGALKSEYIKEPDAILVDDSFSERMDVITQCEILAFDSSMIELLTQQSTVKMNEVGT